MSGDDGRVPDGGDQRDAAGAAAGPRRGLALTILCGVLGAGLAVFAASRTWSVEVTARPAPLPSLRAAHTGGELLPWLPTLALAGLAGAGAVLATRGLARRAVGLLLLLVGVAVAAGGGYGATLGSDGASLPWPLLCALGGVLIGAGGAYTAARGHRWPGMGARYERVPAREGGAGRRTGLAGDGRLRGRETAQAWDALDRGEDPTVTGPGGP